MRKLGWFVLAGCLMLTVTGCTPGKALMEKAVAAGGAHSLVLTEEGDVYSFGWGESGQLGHGNTEDRGVPTKIEGLPAMKAVAAGAKYSLVLTTDGTVYSFGGNEYGQLGHGDTADRSVPTRVEGLPKVKAIAAGGHHFLALTEEGELYACGAGGRGQLGLGDTESRSVPTRIEGLTGVRAIAAGNAHSLALLEDGALYAFGRGKEGQLGVWGEAISDPFAFSRDDYETLFSVFWEESEAERADRLTPVRVAGLAGVKAIAAGLQHSLVILDDGTVYAFGSNEFGQLGHSLLFVAPFAPSPVPQRLLKMYLADEGGEGTAILPVRAASAGHHHTLVVLEDGTLLSCGSKKSGQLGMGEGGQMGEVEVLLQKVFVTGGYRLTPWSGLSEEELQQLRDAGIEVDTQTNKDFPARVKAVAAGIYHSLVLLENGEIYAFGNNEKGQLGLGDKETRLIPTLVESLSPGEADGGSN